MDEVWDAYPRMEPQQVRDALAAFLFRGDDIHRKISECSGGEKGRIALLKLMLNKGNLLLLDEPTNHLDMDSRQVLEEDVYKRQGILRNRAVHPRRAPLCNVWHRDPRTRPGGPRDHRPL